MAKILVIEDDATQRIAAVHVLKKAGYEVIEAEDGEQGLSLVREQHPDLVVCDVRMPRMNGFELLTALRADPAIADTPVIMLTALADRIHMRIGMTAGADDYMVKPLRAMELRESVAALISRRTAQREAMLEGVKTRMTAEFREQQQNLARRYEHQLRREVNERWAQGSEGNTEKIFEDATMLLVELAGSTTACASAVGGLAQSIRNTYIAARDTLFLYGACHVQPYGLQILALYPADLGSGHASPESRAAKAAFALSKTAAGQNLFDTVGSPQDFLRQGLTLALCRGNLTLLHIDDPLHGGPAVSVAVGPALKSLSELLRHAQQAQWQIVTDHTLAERLGPQVSTGREHALAPPPGVVQVKAIELLALKP